MGEKWYYLKDNQENGPISEKDLIDMINNGPLSSNDFIWSDNYGEWMQADCIFSSKVIKSCDLGKPIDKKGLPPIPPLKKYRDINVNQVRPFIRLISKIIDIIIVFFIALVVMFFVYYSRRTSLNDFIILIIVMLMLIPLEALLLSTIGTTPGRFLTNTTIRNYNGYKLSFFKALHRGWLVFFYGFGLGGLGFIIISIFSGAMSYHYLQQNGVTSWDKALKVSVSHKKISVAKWILITIILLLTVFLFFIAIRVAKVSP